MPTLDGAVIAAAGLGSRLGHGVPKCMLEIAGKTILSRLIETLSAHTDRIHVVVGYREELVIDHCAAYHRDVVLVRNPEYRTTNTISSLYLGSRGFAGRTLFIDGDTVLEPRSLAAFLSAAERHDVFMGVAPASSEHAVFTATQRTPDGMQVTGFSRTSPAELEWANVLVANREILAQGSGYVYEALEAILPVPAGSIDLAEVDTEQDLELAIARVTKWDRGASEPE